MAAKRLALSVPLDGFPLAEHAEIAREAERLGYLDAWSLEADGIDCFAPLAVVGAVTSMRLGTAIANVFTRGPALLAQQAGALAEASGGRFVLGIGASSDRPLPNLSVSAFARSNKRWLLSKPGLQRRYQKTAQPQPGRTTFSGNVSSRFCRRFSKRAAKFCSSPRISSRTRRSKRQTAHTQKPRIRSKN